jgi:uncharacterized membrane protein YkvA (DUF1232 family)
VVQRSDLLTALLVIGGLVAAAVLVVAVFYLIRLLRLWRLVRDPAMPTAGKVAFWGALAYTVFPIDVLPDPIYLDDAGVLAFATAFILRTAKKNGLLERLPRGRPDAAGTSDPPQRPGRRSRRAGRPG